MKITKGLRNGKRLGTILALSLIACATACATEGGGTAYPLGVENFAAGAMPPPGIYGMEFAEHYTADRLNDQDGNRVPLNFKITADVIASRFLWITGQKIAGGDLAFHTIVPLVNLDVTIGNASPKKTGIGDITTGIGLGYHHTPQLHTLVGFDVFVPTGDYQKNELANIGRNYWAFEPVYIVSYVDPDGFNGDIKLGYISNLKNNATNYKSGHEFHFDYAAGWGLGNGWTVGAGGYYYQQTSDDQQNNADLANSKGRALAVGPSLKYDSRKGWFLAAKWQKEMAVENRAQGSAIWLKAVFPL